MIGGVIAYFTGQTTTVPGFASVTTYPYRGYAFPLVLLGVVFMVVGLATYKRADLETKSRLQEARIETLEAQVKSLIEQIKEMTEQK